MKKILLLLSLVVIAASPSFAAGSGWTDDYEAAKVRAKEENKPLLLFFTGSDWCPPCMKLHRDVFSKKAFKDYAKEKLILVELDFPKGNQSKKLKEQNQALQRAYAVTGLPSVLLVDSDGKRLGRTGYREGSPEDYVTHLKALLGDKEAADAPPAAKP
jgi:protein disulfide-isomerase